MSLFRSFVNAQTCARRNVLRCSLSIARRRLASSSTSTAPTSTLYAADPTANHRTLAQQQNLFINSTFSPGSPIFQPAGTYILNALVACLRAHYPAFGFQEVNTPNIYKSAIWKKSGHWNHYARDMFAVRTRSDLHLQQKPTTNHDFDADKWALKPMNCPGHCLIFDSQPRSHRQLPLRYADFSVLHRNEVEGALTGLTRVRRFHQDDGHIFCMQSQVEQEILKSLEFVELVYKTIFKLPSYRLVLSTRPETESLGTDQEWNETEAQLKSALDASGKPWSLDQGAGAFYGPKIDIILRDALGKEHQTATIQLDRNLPARFALEYQTPIHGQTEPPVLIHRAIFGSLERFLALIIEHYAGSYPFWLSPRPVTILTVNTTSEELAYTEAIASYWASNSDTFNFDVTATTPPKVVPQPILRSSLPINVDVSSRPLRRKLKAAHMDGYNFIGVVGARDIAAGTITIDVGSQTHGAEHWARFMSQNPSGESPTRMTLTVQDAKALWNSLRDNYH